MANGVDEGVTQFAVYEDENMYYGIAEVKLPDIENEVFNVSGAGLLGSVEIPVAGGIKAMTVTLNFDHVNEASKNLSEQRVHNVSLWRADQHYNYGEGRLEQKQKKILLRIIPKKLSGGTLKNSSPLNVSGEYACHYYCEIDENGNKTCEIDPLNFRYIDHNGNDRAAEIRQCLGMA